MMLSGNEDLEPEAGRHDPLAGLRDLADLLRRRRQGCRCARGGRLVSAFGGKVSPDTIEVGATHRDLFHRAVQYVRTHKSDDFLAERGY